MIGFMIAVGKATQPVWPKPGQPLLSEVIVYDRFADETGDASFA